MLNVSKQEFTIQIGDGSTLLSLNCNCSTNYWLTCRVNNGTSALSVLGLISFLDTSHPPICVSRSHTKSHNHSTYCE